MISIHLGTLDLPTLAGAEVAAKPDDYVAARLAIREALRTSSDLEIFVLSTVCDPWFWDLEEHHEVRILQDDPVTVLCQKLRVLHLPAEIASADVISALGLLTLPNPTEPVSDILGWVVGQKMAEVWTVTQPSYDHLTRLLTWLASNSVPTLLEPVVSKRLKLWLEQSRGVMGDVYRSLLNDIQGSVLFLCTWQALRAYDEDIRIRWLKEEGWYHNNLEGVVNKLGELPIPQIAQEKISGKAAPYWRRRLGELDQQVAQ